MRYYWGLLFILISILTPLISHAVGFGSADSLPYVRIRLRSLELFTPQQRSILLAEAGNGPFERLEILQSRCSLLLTRIPSAIAQKNSLRVSLPQLKEYLDPSEFMMMEIFLQHAMYSSSLEASARRLGYTPRQEWVLKVARYLVTSFVAGVDPDPEIAQSELGKNSIDRLALLLSASRLDRQGKRLDKPEFRELSQRAHTWAIRPQTTRDLVAFALTNEAFLGALKPQALIRAAQDMQDALAGLHDGDARLNALAHYIYAMVLALETPHSQGALGRLMEIESRLKWI